MRLISARIQGFGRLADTKINLDSKVIAIVGPNEAGKTTLLKALAQVGSEAAVSVPQRSRAVEVKDDMTVVSLEYVLDDEDRNALAGLDLEESPQFMTVGKAAGGAVTVDIRPLPVKALAPLKQAAKAAGQGSKAKGLDDWIDPDSAYADPDSDTPRDYRAELSAVVDGADAFLADPTSILPEDFLDKARSLLVATLDTSSSTTLRAALDRIVAWAERADPDPEAQTRLWNRTPDFLLFEEADRDIQATYALDEILDPEVPAALKNLAGMAGLGLRELLTFVQTGDIARRDTAIIQANTRLNEIFDDAWKQARLAVRFSVDGSLLRILLWEDGDNITVFDERSAGLRMFVALIAFLKMHGSSRSTVLLIDEAENHLHIDAQADLVNMFVTQEHAIKIVYTTHSPACLPPDLGSGIRSVVPRSDDLQISDVKNSFWQEAAGYSPLMLAMGAAAAAFTPARCVVLAEGATEMILLPTLIRASTGEGSLPYQIAPGLSEVPKDFYPSLDFEGAKVAYLLDGDTGGDDLEKGLVNAGVPKNLVSRLTVAGTENLLKAESYGAAISALLVECNPGKVVLKLPELGEVSGGSWAKEIGIWITGEGLKAPSKVAVANWLIENGEAVPSAEGTKQLKALHKALKKSLGLN